MHREDPNKKILWGEGGMKKIENKKLWMKITTKFENKLERNLRGKFPESFQKVGCWWGALKNVSFKWSQHSSQPHATDHTSFILGIHPWGCEHDAVECMDAFHPLREKCPNTELFLVRLFLYSDWIRTRNNSVFEHFSSSDQFIFLCARYFFLDINCKVYYSKI